MRFESWAELFNLKGFNPYWTCPKPAQFEDQEIVTLVESACTDGPFVKEQTVGVEVKVVVSVGTGVLLEVEVAVDVAVSVGVNVGVGVIESVGVSVAI